jgi:hypothetical protein
MTNIEVAQLRISPPVSELAAEIRAAMKDQPLAMKPVALQGRRSNRPGISMFTAPLSNLPARI